MIINLTPHAIHFPDKSIFPSLQPARCKEESEVIGMVDGIELIHRKYGEVTGLPEPKEGTLYIVSMIVREALPNRKDIASPGDFVRDKDGNIIFTRNLIVNP